MKEEALKLADEILLCTTDPLHSKTSAMIRRLVEELNKQKEKAKWFEESNKMFKETRDSLAMAVMLDQTSHDTTPQTKPLSDEEIIKVFEGNFNPNSDGTINSEVLAFARAIEERHGIK